jgi:hypothetical protein
MRFVGVVLCWVLLLQVSDLTPYSPTSPISLAWPHVTFFPTVTMTTGRSIVLFVEERERKMLIEAQFLSTLWTCHISTYVHASHGPSHLLYFTIEWQRENIFINNYQISPFHRIVCRTISLLRIKITQPWIDRVKIKLSFRTFFSVKKIFANWW